MKVIIAIAELGDGSILVLSDDTFTCGSGIHDRPTFAAAKPLF
jgi:hypothetical protein